MLSGNRNAFAELVRRHETRVRGYCRTVLGSREQAEDAAQEIFIKAYRSLDAFRGSSAFSTWIYRITVNHCTDIIRKLARSRTESWEALLEKEGEKIETSLSADLRPQPSEISEQVARALAELPEKSRQILVLREVNELSYQELTQALDCSLDAVKSRLRRARQELAARLRHFSAARAV